MTREQANIEAEKIFKERNKKVDEAIEEAKRNGTWVSGLDTNRALYEPIDREVKEKLRKLYESIDE